MIFWQWDSNRSITFDDLQDGDKVSFAQYPTTGDDAYVLVAYLEDGTPQVDVPNDMMQVAEPIKVYLQRDGKTVLKQTIHVQAREKPQDYIYEQTQVKTWEDIEESASEAIQASESAKSNAEKAEQASKTASEASESAQQYAESALWSAREAKEAAESVTVASVEQTKTYLGMET